MKRALLQNVKVAPYESGAVIDRQGFLSAIAAAEIATAGVLTLTVTHSDTSGGTYTAVKDTHILVDENSTIVTDGKIDLTATVGEVENVDLDLLGCKPFVKITASGTAATDAVLAYALGDPQIAPV